MRVTLRVRAKARVRVRARARSRARARARVRVRARAKTKGSSGEQRGMFWAGKFPYVVCFAPLGEGFGLATASANVCTALSRSSQSVEGEQASGFEA